MASVT